MDLQAAVLLLAVVVADSLHRCCCPALEDADVRRAFETAAVYSYAPDPRQAWQCAVTLALVLTCQGCQEQQQLQPVAVVSSVPPEFFSPTATSVVPIAQFVVWHVAQRLDAASDN